MTRMVLDWCLHSSVANGEAASSGSAVCHGEGVAFVFATKQTKPVRFIVQGAVFVHQICRVAVGMVEKRHVRL